MKKLNVVNLNNYVKPNPHTLVTQSNQYVTNGPDNDFFYYVEDRYLGSPTNQSVIDNISNYIMGMGIKVETGNVDINSIISKEDLRSFVTDFKIHGAGVLQVIYSFSREKRIAKLIYLPTRSIAIKKQADLADDIEGYWYCYDWKNKTRFKPTFVPAFGYGKDNETEILYIKRPSPQPLFPVPDYLSGLQYAKVEEELSNYYVNHIQNNFAAGKIVNIYQGKDWTDEAMDEAEAAILNKVKGTSNAGNIIVAFNDSTEGKTTVDSIEITDAYQQFETLSSEAKEKILLAHKIVDPILVGLPQPSGFSSQADQMAMSLKLLYRSQINPIRDIILKGLEEALKLNDATVKLEFVDFEEMDTKDEPLNTAEIFSIIEKLQANVITYDLALLMVSKALKMSLDEARVYLPQQQANLSLAGIKIGFDFDETANTAKGKEMIAAEIANNNDVYLISARSDDSTLKEFATANGIALSRVYAVGSNAAKVQKVTELGLDSFYDNNPDVIAQLPNIGKLFNN